MEQPAETESLIGKELGSYHIERKLGAGGMGVVFEATHRQIGQRVAIKLLHNHIARDGKTFQRFENEAKAIGRIKHPGLVNIHGYENTADGVAYIVMEFLQGEALYDRLEKLRAEQKRLPCAQAVSLIRQVAAALSEAHAHGIVHCDLKPDKITPVEKWLSFFRRPSEKAEEVSWLCACSRKRSREVVSGVTASRLSVSSLGVGELGQRLLTVAHAGLLWKRNTKPARPVLALDRPLTFPEPPTTPHALIGPGPNKTSSQADHGIDSALGSVVSCALL